MSAWGPGVEEVCDVEGWMKVATARRAEIFLELLGEQVQRCRTQALLIADLQEKIARARRENAELSEALEEAEQAREEAESREWVR